MNDVDGAGGWFSVRGRETDLFTSTCPEDAIPE